MEGVVCKPGERKGKRGWPGLEGQGTASGTCVGQSAWSFSGEVGNLSLHVFLASSFPPSSEPQF